MGISEDPSYVSLGEAKRHSNGEDCWIIVHSKVYGEHPRGSGIILKYAGTDATAAYDEIHAPGILENTLPQDCLIGLIEQIEMEELQTQTNAATALEIAALQAVVVQKELSMTFSKPKQDEKPDLFKFVSVYDF